MQPEPAERRRQTGRRQREESGHSRGERRGKQLREAGTSVRSSEEETTRFTEIVAVMQQKEKQAGGEEEEERGRGRDRSRGGGGGVRRERGRRAASEGGGDGGEEAQRLRWRINELEKEKLQLTSLHNQQLCELQAELTRLRSTVERGEAQRAELQYQLTMSQRDRERVAALSRDKRTLTEQTAHLLQTLQELQRVVDITRRGREQDQHALQQEVEERDKLIQSLSDENQRLHRLMKEQEEALQEAHRAVEEVQRERDKEEETRRRQEDELKNLREREELSRREKESERSSHLETKFNSEIVQMRLREVEAALASERCDHQEARDRLKEVERGFSLERERRDATEHALNRLQSEHERRTSDLSVALETERKTTSDLSERLEDEKRRHEETRTKLQQAAQTQAVTEHGHVTLVESIRAALGCGGVPPTVHDGKWSPDVVQLLKTTLGDFQLRLKEAELQVQTATSASERRREEIESLSVELEQRRRDAARLQQENDDWSRRSGQLEAELQKEREELQKEREELQKQREELQKEREELQTEREERAAETMKELQQKDTERLSFLHRLSQRLLAGCVLLHQPQSLLGDFTWAELCDIIEEQLERLTSDLRDANAKVAQLQSVCDKKSVCVRELQRRQRCVLSRLEEAWSGRHAVAVTTLQSELQVSHSQCDALRGHASSLELRLSSLTSDLSRLQGVLGRRHREASCLLAACSLLAGALRHADRRLRELRDQKSFLSRRLAEKEALEEEVRSLADALGGEEEEEEKGRRAARRWRSSVWAVLAVRRWRSAAEQTAVMLRVERGGGVGVACVETTSTDDDDEGVPTRWLRSKRLSAAVMSAMTDLTAALAHAGSAPPDVMSAARSGLSRLLDHVLDRAAPKPTPRPLNAKDGEPRPTSSHQALVATLHRHFLLFSQRLHSAEVERRSLRLEVANLKRGLRRQRGDGDGGGGGVPEERFHSACMELRQALNREQEAQTLILEQNQRLKTLQRRVDEQTTQQNDAQRTFSSTSQALLEARQEVTRKDRSLRILGKHLSAVQKERKQLEERLRRAEDELTDAARRKDRLIGAMKAAETSYKEVRESIVQSRRPLPLPREHLAPGGAEGIMGAPEVVACQSLLAAVAQLCLACSSRIDWLEQEVSAHRSHVTALRSELQDACLRDNQAFVFPSADVETPLFDFLKDPPLSLNPAPSQTNPAPSQTNPAPSQTNPAPSQTNPAPSSSTSSSPPPLTKPPRTKTKEKKTTKKNRGHVKKR